MAAQHTPGPYAKTYTHGVGWSLHAPSDLADSVPGITIRVATAIGNKPDASLFAAAPEMLEALLLLRSNPISNEAQKAMHAAIAKAVQS